MQTAINKGIGFLLTLSVNAVVTVGEPVEKQTGTIIWIVFRQSLNTIAVQSISKALFAVGSLEFEVVSDTHELNAISRKLLFKPSPIVTSLHIIIFIVDSTHDVSSREPPLAVFLVPNGSYFAVVEKADRLLTYFSSSHAFCISFVRLLFQCGIGLPIPFLPVIPLGFKPKTFRTGI